MTKHDDIWKRAEQMASDEWDDKSPSCSDWLFEALERERGDQAYEAATELYRMATSGVIDGKTLDELKELWIEYGSEQLYSAAAAELQDEADAFRETMDEARREEARQSTIRG